MFFWALMLCAGLGGFIVFAVWGPDAPPEGVCDPVASRFAKQQFRTVGGSFSAGAIVGAVLVLGVAWAIGKPTTPKVHYGQQSTVRSRPFVAGETYVNSYFRRDGTFVQGHRRTTPDSFRSNNWSARGNRNPYTGRPGTQ